VGRIYIGRDSVVECISIKIFSSVLNLVTLQLNVDELSVVQTVPKIMNQKPAIVE
jgi:hypothetical protein